MVVLLIYLTLNFYFLLLARGYSAHDFHLTLYFRHIIAFFLSPAQVGRHRVDMVQSFYNKTFTGPRVAVVGVGVDHRRMTAYAKQLNLESGDGAAAGDPKYFGGEQRQEAATGRRAYLAVGGQCAGGGNNIKEAVAAMVLQRVWGESSVRELLR